MAHRQHYHIPVASNQTKLIAKPTPKPIDEQIGHKPRGTKDLSKTTDGTIAKPIINTISITISTTTTTRRLTLRILRLLRRPLRTSHCLGLKLGCGGCWVEAEVWAQIQGTIGNTIATTTSTITNIRRLLRLRK